MVALFHTWIYRLTNLTCRYHSSLLCNLRWVDVFHWHHSRSVRFKTSYECSLRPLYPFIRKPYTLECLHSCSARDPSASPRVYLLFLVKLLTAMPLFVPSCSHSLAPLIRWRAMAPLSVFYLLFISVVLSFNLPLSLVLVGFEPYLCVTALLGLPLCVATLSLPCKYIIAFFIVLVKGFSYFFLKVFSGCII